MALTIDDELPVREIPDTPLWNETYEFDAYDAGYRLARRLRGADPWRNAILTVAGGARGVAEQKPDNEGVSSWYIGGASATMLHALDESLAARGGWS